MCTIWAITVCTIWTSMCAQYDQFTITLCTIWPIHHYIVHNVTIIQNSIVKSNIYIQLWPEQEKARPAVTNQPWLDSASGNKLSCCWWKCFTLTFDPHTKFSLNWSCSCKCNMTIKAAINQLQSQKLCQSCVLSVVILFISDFSSEMT